MALLHLSAGTAFAVIVRILTTRHRSRGGPSLIATSGSTLVSVGHKLHAFWPLALGVERAQTESLQGWQWPGRCEL
jgi:hypothetical protein